jgi:hypothetical protein
MKKHLLITLSATLLITASSFVASECGLFNEYVKGTQYTTTSYDATGKVQGSTDATVKSITVAGAKTTAVMEAVSKDAAGVAKDTNTFDFICEDGMMRMDLSALARQQASAQGAAKDAEVSVEADMLQFPATMTVGQALPGGNIKVTVKTKDSPLVVVTNITIKDRKCVAIESRTTPAGTWECYKITATLEGSTRMGTFNMPMPPTQTTEWFSNKVGSVRSESYQKGKLQGYTELTAFKKPAQ